MTSDFRLLHWPVEDRASLERFAEAMTEVKSRIEAISGEVGGVPVPRLPRVPSAQECAGVILRRRLDLRRLAGDHADMLGDPAWEILLALFQSDAPMREAGILEAIGLPMQGQAGLRWVRLLVDRGWLIRDEAGLSLGQAGKTLLERYFAGV